MLWTKIESSKPRCVDDAECVAYRHEDLECLGDREAAHRPALLEMLREADTGDALGHEVADSLVDTAVVHGG